MLSIADRLDDAFRSLSEETYPTAIELNSDDAIDFQIWIDVCARRAPQLIEDRWRFGGVPVTRIDACSSRIVCLLEGSAEGSQVIRRSIVTL